jgi:predicted lysophospholipase L1 biosynthesis ABC-type transport system permease subunit
MKVQSVDGFSAVVVLSGDDCLLLAEALEAGMDHFSPKAREKDLYHVETLGAAFKALGLAAWRGYVMPPGAARELGAGR